jgi:hypothetical protein
VAHNRDLQAVSSGRFVSASFARQLAALLIDSLADSLTD